MQEFLTHVHWLSPLDNKEAKALIGISKQHYYKKGDCLLAADQKSKRLYFINNGLVKLSFFRGDKELIMKFFSEKGFCAALDGFETQRPSNYTITAIEDTRLIEIDYAKLETLAGHSHAIEKMMRKICSVAIVNMMDRISEMLESNATERYLNFLKNNGHLVNRISLGDLSGYLGISQVSLSRLRNKLTRGQSCKIPLENTP